jgi:hypothetical protein
MDDPNDLSQGGTMFRTIQGPQHLLKTAKNLSSSDSQLATMMNKHGAKKFFAAVKSQGLEPDGLDKNSWRDKVTVDPKVPAASVAGITEHRTKLWDGLRESRIQDVNRCLETMNDEEVQRYMKCKTGIHPVDPYKDLPPVDQLAGMEKFAEMQAANFNKIKEEQRRKATMLGLDFLMEKKKRDDAEAKVAAFEKRMQEYKAKQVEEWKARAQASQKKAEKRKQDAERAAKARADWEEETEAHLWDRFSGARQRRAITYSPDTITAKLEANKQKRIAAFHQATKQEEEMVQNLENRRIATEERLEADRQANEAYLAQRRANSQGKFQQKQVLIHAKTTEWVNQKLSDHKDYKAKCGKAASDYNDLQKEKSKSTKDTRDKVWSKVKVNKERLRNNQNNSNQELIERHEAADERRRELQSMAIKNENDIHTFREIKHHSFGELCKRRNDEIKKRGDAHQQHLVYVLAERAAKDKHQELSMFDLRKARQQMGKESLKLFDDAQEGFLKIQSENDPAKVIAKMNSMGFDMPKLPEKDEEGGEEEAAKGF